MTAVRLDQLLQAFPTDGFEIYDSDLASTGEVLIFAPARSAPCEGDEFTLESNGHAHDVEVRDVVSFEGGGWSARCKVKGWV